MKKLKVVFFGTPEFAQATLEAIHKSTHQVVGVVTVADKASGRGQKIHESAVKKYAVAQNLPVFQPHKLRDPEFLNQMQALKADVFVVVAFRMMPEMLFSIPPMGTFNLHASLLPDYRGAAPINFAVVNGEKYSGVTTFFINKKIDEGNILLQEKVEILPTDNAGDLHDKLMQVGARLVIKTLDGLAENSITEKPQPQVQQPKLAHKIFKEDLEINWNQKSVDVHNFIRGMSPYPTAFTTLQIGDELKTLKIFKGSYKESPQNKAAGSLIIDNQTFNIVTADGVYIPEEVQLAGKRRMHVKDFLNGIHHFSEVSVKSKEVD